MVGGFRVNVGRAGERVRGREGEGLGIRVRVRAWLGFMVRVYG